MHRLALSLLLAVAGCRPAAPAPALHELPRFDGRVVVRVGAAGARVVADGELVFDRHAENFQLVFRGAHTRSLSRLPNGEIRAFDNGVPAPPTAAERTAFATVLGLVDGAPAGAIERWQGGYRFGSGAGTTTVELTPSRPSHGRRESGR